MCTARKGEAERIWREKNWKLETCGCRQNDANIWRTIKYHDVFRSLCMPIGFVIIFSLFFCIFAILSLFFLLIACLCKAIMAIYWLDEHKIVWKNCHIFSFAFYSNKKVYLSYFRFFSVQYFCIPIYTCKL